MSDRTGASLLRDVLENIDRTKLDLKAKRVAALAAWKAGDAYDFTGWQVLDDAADAGLGERLDLSRSSSGDDGEPSVEVRDMCTGDWR